MEPWKTNPNQLAWKMLEYIEAENRDVLYSELEARAVTHGIDLDILDTSLQKLHKHNKIDQRVKGGEIVYRPVGLIKVKPPGTHLSWVRKNYPPMTDSNNGSGIEADYSYLFLTPEELEKYKAEVMGRAYVPKKKYEKKVKAGPTKAQMQLLGMSEL